ncbi:MAG TPA: 2Fe-2S iron-sulfur cluster-binding protein, partial [Clostridia bacterium]|nr:2Fe-2S iron-sulfur cluster-binding protein [Clostridia bacterium]
NILSDEQKEGYAHGFITAQRIKEAACNEQCSLFVCGPCAMYEFLERELAALGYERKFIRREVYVAPQSPKDIPGYEGDLSKELTLTVRTYGNIHKIPMSANETVLVALERSGIDAPSKCRGGECGFCRSRLEKGDVFVPKTLDYRRMADAASGYIHPCSCYPLTDLSIEIWPE